jgi:hypothetical protein
MANISAGALAFAGIDSSSWGARALLAGALGSSLSGVFALHILSVYAAMFPIKVFGDGLKSGENTLKAHSWIVAYTLASPAVICIYTTGLVLSALLLFAFTLDGSTGTQKLAPGSARWFKVIALTPMLCCVLSVAVTLCLVEMMWRKGFGNKKLRDEVEYSGVPHIKSE